MAMAKKIVTKKAAKKSSAKGDETQRENFGKRITGSSNKKISLQTVKKFDAKAKNASIGRKNNPVSAAGYVRMDRRAQRGAN